MFSSNVVCSPTITNIGDVLCKISSILQLILPILVLLGVVYFIWGVVTLVIGNDEEAKKRGKDRIIYGIIGFVVIAAMWGLVAIVIRTFGLNENSQIVSGLINNTSSISEQNMGVCNLGANPKLSNLFNYVTCFINSSIIPLLITLTVAMFIWGVVQFVANSDEESKREKGKQFMIWGIIGLVVMVGVWGLVKIVGSTFGIEYVIPQVKQ